MSSTPEDDGGTKQQIPPYLSHKTFNNFIEGLRAGVPDRIDRSVMATLSGTAQAHLLYALRYLNLVNAEGKPSALLNQLPTAEDKEKQRILHEILKSSYPFVFNGSLDLERCTGKQIEEAFATTGASSETLRKSLAFFLATAKQAGLKLSPHMKRTRRSPRGASQRARGAAASGRGATQGATGEPLTPPTPPQDEQRGTNKTIQLRRGGSLTLSYSVNLWELKGEDRKFVFDLIDKIDAYEEGSDDNAALPLGKDDVS